MQPQTTGIDVEMQSGRLIHLEMYNVSARSAAMQQDVADELRQLGAERYTLFRHPAPSRVQRPCGDLHTARVRRHLLPPSPESDFHTVLFFIHGLGGSSHVWQRSVDLNKLAACGFEIIFIDLIGHGQSSKTNSTGAYSFELVMTDLMGVFDSFCKRSNVVIGHSMGGNYGALLASRRPSLINQLVLISTGDFDDTIFSKVPLNPVALGRRFFTFVFPSMRFMMNRMLTKQKVGPHFDVKGEILYGYMKGNVWNSPNARQYRFFSDIPDSCYTLQLHGTDDMLIPWSAALKDHVQADECVLLKDCGHVAHLEWPEVVRSHVERFVLTVQHVRLELARAPAALSDDADWRDDGRKAAQAAPQQYWRSFSAYQSLLLTPLMFKPSLGAAQLNRRWAAAAARH